MPTMILETNFTEPLTDEEHARTGKEVDGCLSRYGARWMRSFLSGDRMRMICQFEAPDAEAVRAAYRAAGVRFESVWSAEVYQRE